MVVNLLLALLILVAIVLLIAIIGVLGLWLSGPSSIAFPGLGVVVASGVVLTLLVVIEIAVVFGAAHLTRHAVGSWLEVEIHQANDSSQNLS